MKASFSYHISFLAPIVSLYLSPLYSAPAFQEVGGIVAGDAEDFSSRTSFGGQDWLVVPTESIGSGSFSNARGGEYIQFLSDSGINNSPSLNPPWATSPTVAYQMNINTTGTYNLYVRWDGLGGNSDSFYADIVELKDGTGGTEADWYRLATSVDANFATNSWHGMGAFESVSPAGGNITLSWDIASPGTYSLRFSGREDGAAIDAWAFQRSNLAAPTGLGPASTAIPEPSTAILALLGFLLLHKWKAYQKSE